MRSPNTRPSFSAVLLSSVALHGVLLWALQGEARQTPAPKPTPVRITVNAAPVPAPVPVPAAAPAPEAPTPPAPARRMANAAPKSKPHDSAPTQVSAPIEPTKPASEPVDFTGVTLTSTNGAASWASVTGNGEAIEGPLGAPPRGTRTGHGTRGEGVGEGNAGDGATVVGLGSLSRPPRAPSLDDALVTNYPRSAREQGQPGRAVVRARILPDGRVGHTEVLIASAPEFGKACQRTLSGSRWSAPLDARGEPVATDVSYTCQFEVTR